MLLTDKQFVLHLSPRHIVLAILVIINYQKHHISTSAIALLITSNHNNIMKTAINQSNLTNQLLFNTLVFRKNLYDNITHCNYTIIVHALVYSVASHIVTNIH